MSQWLLNEAFLKLNENFWYIQNMKFCMWLSVIKNLKLFFYYCIAISFVNFNEIKKEIHLVNPSLLSTFYLDRAKSYIYEEWYISKKKKKKTFYFLFLFLCKHILLFQSTPFKLIKTCILLDFFVQIVFFMPCHLEI